MATEDVVSTPVTNANAGTFNNSGVTNGHQRQSVATVEVGAVDAASTYRFFRLPSNATGISLIFASDDLGTTPTVNVGLYDINGGAVVDATLFASAINVNSAAVAPTEIAHESGTYDISKIEQPLWQVLGLSADPQKEYDVTAVLAAASDVGGTMSIRGSWAI